MIEGLDENIALFVPSCDAFDDISIQFFRYFDKFMPWWKNKKYLVVEQKKVEIPGVTSVYTGNDANWTFRMKRALEEINEEYFLFLLDDYYIGNPVSEHIISEAYDIVKKENLRYYQLNNRPKRNGLVKKYKGYNFLYSIPNNIRYGIVLGEGIFRRDFFLEMLGKEDKSIWRVETDRLIDVDSNNGEDIEGCVIDCRNILCAHYGIQKGQWNPDTIKYFEKIGMPIDKGNRKTQSKSKRVYHKLCGIADSHLSPKQIRFVKRIASKFGFKFVTNQ